MNKKKIFIIGAVLLVVLAVFGSVMLLKERNSMKTVPDFRDDTGKLVQQAEGYLYGYWEGSLCWYDSETLEKTVLFEASSKQSGNFCIQEGYVYFMERPFTNSLEDRDITLYRVKCDGTECQILAEYIRNPSIEYFASYYEIDIYEDILYLMNTNGNLYYHMNRDGSVTEVSEKATLYGSLPEGYTPARYENIPTLPYCMRNYGYSK